MFEPGTNPCPFSVTWSSELPCGVDDGLIDPICGMGFDAAAAAMLLVNRWTAGLPFESAATNAKPFVPQRIRLLTRESVTWGNAKTPERASDCWRLGVPPGNRFPC